ncbi:MAG: PmeII family type II restriction endonuclease [Candidatus Humimicrobiaceae bacterium]
MKTIYLNHINNYVNENISKFHQNKIDSLKKLKLKQILIRKNPYLFKAKNIMTGQDLVKTLLDAYLSSQEETLFGDFLEGLAIYICKLVYNGRKSSAEGLDLEFERNNIRYVVSIKSGPNWSNSRQIQKMKDDFKKTIKILKTNNPNINVKAINGCCYGRDNSPDKGEYYKYCGQAFWEFISGNNKLYIDIIDPLGYEAKKKNDEFFEAYSEIINSFTSEFLTDFCSRGKIDWETLVKFNSSK